MDARGVRWAMEGPRCRNADPSDCTRCRALEGRAVRSTLGDQKKMQATDLDVETPSLRSCVLNSPFEYEKNCNEARRFFWFFWNSKNDLIPEPDFDPNLSNPPDGKPTELWLKARDKKTQHRHYSLCAPAASTALAPCFLQRKKHHPLSTKAHAATRVQPWV